MTRTRSSSEDSQKTAVNSEAHMPSPTSPFANLPSSPIKAAFSLPSRILEFAFTVVYIALQYAIAFVFTPPPPTHHATHDGRKPFGRIAIIGGGLTGISSAAHCVAHGFEVVIFEKKGITGGIWADVNKTSGLQLNSLLYRFHPSVVWSGGFPKQTEILSNIKLLWKRYDLDSRTRFNYEVTSIHRHHSSTDPIKSGHARWVVNDGAEGVFDAVIASIGTCSEPKMLHLPGTDSFKGEHVHSSRLDNVELKGKRVIMLGSGASGVEAAELGVAKGAKECLVLARSDKWIIPRNIIASCALSLQPWGRETIMSKGPEWLLKTFHYRDLKWMAPTRKGLYEGTPIVNESFLDDVRSGKCQYLRGDILEIVPEGVKFNLRKDPYSKSGDRGEEIIIKADVIVSSTGFKRPSLDFLPKDLFPVGPAGQPYSPPNLYLQTFATADWSILLTNAAYQDALGTVGHVHIGIYTRILLTFLLDEAAAPKPKDMQLWVDCIRFIKESAPGGALAFFTYAELTIWLVAFHAFRIQRLRWIFFTLFGWGVTWKSPLQMSGSWKELQTRD